MAEWRWFFLCLFFGIAFCQDGDKDTAIIDLSAEYGEKQARDSFDSLNDSDKREIVKFFIDALRSEDPYEREVGSRALKRISELSNIHAKEALSSLIKATKDQSSTIRKNALLSIDDIGLDAVEKALPEIKKLADDPNSDVRSFAKLVLYNFEKKKPSGAEKIAETLTGEKDSKNLVIVALVVIVAVLALVMVLSQKKNKDPHSRRTKKTRLRRR